MTVPHDLEAERALLSSLMRSAADVDQVALAVTVRDFHSPAHASMFAAIVGLHSEGIKPDSVTVLERVTDVEASTFAAVVAFEASTSNIARYAARVAELSVRRRLIAAAGQLRVDAVERDPGEALDRHIAELESIQLPHVDAQGLMPLDDLLDRPDDQRSPWVVPGLLRRDWRAIVVASEGIGKTLMLQQVALAASQGVHPFQFSRGHRPVATLLVDAENPDERIQDGCRPIRDVLTRMCGGWEQRTFLWHRPGGLDLRSTRDVAAFEDVLYRVQPELVCMGPVYKLTDRKPGESWEEPARAMQIVLDRLRVRFQFALLLEDHAPQTANGQRDLRPFGSSMWLRWPELGLKLIRPTEDASEVRVGHWRGARLAHSWPDELHRGGQGSLPWVGYWKDGMNG